MQPPSGRRVKRKTPSRALLSVRALRDGVGRLGVVAAEEVAPSPAALVVVGVELREVEAEAAAAAAASCLLGFQPHGD